MSSRITFFLNDPLFKTRIMSSSFQPKDLENSTPEQLFNSIISKLPQEDQGLIESKSISIQLKEPDKIFIHLENPPNIKKPITDSKTYTYKELKQGRIKLLHIHDQATTKSGISIAFLVGSMKNDKIKGLAHFLEHMLFYGSKSAEINLQLLIAKCGGETNAFTACEKTVYMFTFISHFLKEVVTALVETINNPLLPDKFCEKEKHAIHNEFSKNICNPGWRVYLVYQSILRSMGDSPAHPYSNFSCGNLVTLKNAKPDDLREFMKWYRKVGIHITVYSNNTFETDSEAIKEFEKINTEEKVEIVYPPDPLNPILKKLIHIKPNVEVRTLTLQFQMDPKIYKDYKANNFIDISTLIEFKGYNGLMSSLRGKKWALEVECGLCDVYTFLSVFTVEFQLTEEGMKNYRAIIAMFFAYIEFLKKLFSDKSDKIEVFFELIETIQDIKFRYRDASPVFSTIESLVQRFERYPVEDLLYGPYRTEKSNQEKTFMNRIWQINAENMVVTLIDCDMDTGNVSNLRVEEFDGVPYYVEDLQYNKEQEGESPFQLDFTFVQDKLNKKLKSIADREIMKSKTEIESKIVEKEIWKNVKLYIKPDSTFEKPQFSVFLKYALSEVKNPKGFNNKELILYSIYIRMLSMYLEEKYPYFLMVGCSLNFIPTNEGFELAFTGYNSILHLFIEQVFPLLKTVLHGNLMQDMTDYFRKLFPDVLDAVKKSAVSSKICQPYVQCFSMMKQLLFVCSVPVEQSIKDLSEITWESFVEFFNPEPKNDKKYFALQILVFGQIEEQEENNTINFLEKIICHEEIYYVPVEDAYMNTPRLPENSVCFDCPSSNLAEKNSANIVAISLGPLTEYGQAMLEVFNSIAKTSFFNELRSNQQLGYIVTTMCNESRGIYFWIILVQSINRDPEYLYECETQYLKHFTEHVSNVNKDDFLKFIQNYIARMKEPFKNYGEKLMHYWQQISSGRLEFDWKEKRIKILEGVQDKPCILALLQKMLWSNIFNFSVYGHGKDREQQFKMRKSDRMVVEQNRNGVDDLGLDSEIVAHKYDDWRESVNVYKLKSRRILYQMERCSG